MKDTIVDICENIIDLATRIFQVFVIGVIIAIISGIVVGLFLSVVYWITNIF